MNLLIVLQVHHYYMEFFYKILGSLEKSFVHSKFLAIAFACMAVNCFGQLAGHTMSAKNTGHLQKVWIDADTGNETDDIYAIARLLADPGVEVLGVSSAHFNNADLVAFQKWNQYETKHINTVQISQELNEDLLAVMGKKQIPHPLGAGLQMGRAWGGREPRSSPAGLAIIAAVKQLAPNEKLVVLNLGALTNIASAIAKDTSITKHLVCYALGAKYDTIKSVWNKNEFNIQNDLNAFDYLLDDTALDFVVMPINIAYPYRFLRDFLYDFLSSDVPLQNMLKTRWKETNPDDKERTLWDLALVEAYLKPEFATLKTVMTPSENIQRNIRIYSGLQLAPLKADFMDHVKKYGKD